jgi:carbon-monoxide dehydrogenase medium subunit
MTTTTLATEHLHENHMTNTHLMVNPFDYYEPQTVDEAITLLGRYKGKARLMAGGTHLIVQMKMEKDAPEAVINIGKIPGLGTIEMQGDGTLVIGANVSIRTLRDHPMIRERYTALSDACAAFGSTQIQLMGTIGGNICNGSPASDTTPALMVLNARLVLQNTAGMRVLPLVDFLVGPGKTAIKDGEILTSIELPPLPENAVSGFYKMSRVAADLAKASLAVLYERDGNTIASCRLAYGSVAPTVIRIPEVESILTGQTFSQALLENAGQAASGRVTPITDTRSTAAYRRQIVKVMLVDLLTAMWESKPGPVRGLGKAPNQPQIIPASQPSSGLQILANEKREIELNINGQTHKVWVRSHDLLLNVIREQFFLTGSKYGCGVGECSACSVLVDGNAELSCLVLAASVNGRQITTIEGLQQPDGKLDPLQQAFIDHAAFQCGYCTPGFIMSVKSLLHENPNPSEDEVRDYLKGNRCRCTGYTSIVKAVLAHVQDGQKTG